MILLRLCHNIFLRLLVILVIISSLIVPPAFCQETEDSQVFIAGFNAYQQKDYASSIEKMNEVLQKYPDTPLRDMALFWLARSYYKAGNQREAARYLSLFSKEYPDNPLKSTVEDELIALTSRFEKGEVLPTGTPPAKQPDRMAAQKAKAEKERIAAAKAEEAKLAAAAAENARIAAAKAEQERIASVKAEEARRAAAAETARIAALKLAEEKAVAEKAEQERLAAVKAEQVRIAQETAAREQAERERIAAVRAEEARKAAELAEQQRITAAKAEETRIAAAAAETARIAALKLAEEKAAAEKAEQERMAAVKAEQERIAQETAAREKAELERIAAVRAEEVRKATELAEQQRIAAARAEEARIAAAAAETAKIAALRLAEEKAAAEKAEQERIAAVKAEQERIAQETAAREKAEQERATAKAEEERKIAEAEATRIAALKQGEEKAAAEKAEQERLAAVKAEQERMDQETAGRMKAEQERVAAARAEEARKAAELAEQQRIAAVRAEETRAAAAAAETARIAALRLAEEKAAAEKAEQQRLAAAKVEQERIAQETAALMKAEQERVAATRAEEARKAAELAEQQRIAAVRAEEARIAAAAAETARIAALKLAEEKAAAEKAEQERLAAVKSEQARIAQETAARMKAEQERVAAARAEEALKAEAAKETARIAFEKAESERLVKAQAEAELIRMNAIQAENERKVAAENERIALAKAEEARQASVAAESARLAAVTAEEERRAAEKLAKEEEERRLTALKAEENRLAEQKRSEEKVRAAKLAYREKAIGQYKNIIDKYPDSPAAVTAVAKLRELGIAVAMPPKPVEAPLPENAQVLNLRVAQFAGFEFNLLPRADAFTVGKPVNIPFEVINRGNGNDFFNLESAFPAGFKARFASATTPGLFITQTPELAPGEAFNGVINLAIPPANIIDGMRISHPVKAVSNLITEASQSREVRLVASAPLLRAVVHTDKTKPLPGEKVVYHIAVLNVGSTLADDVTFRLNFPPQLEPVDYAGAGFKQEMKAALVFDGLQVNSGESREFSVTFQLKDDSLAGQEITTRAELINNPLKTTAAFVSNVAFVEPRHGILVRTALDRLVAIPGQTVTVPFVVTNRGNVREKFKIASAVNGAQDAIIFNDLNRDGIRQANEPVISEIGPLSPQEEANIVVEVKTPRAAADGSQGGVRITFVSEGDAASSASGATQLTYSRPVLKMVMAGRDGLLKPGDVASFDLAITNNGSNLARIVELQSAWPEQLELVAADTATTAVNNGNIVWRFKELGAGEKRSIKVSFRVKPGTSAGTAIQVKNILTYEDQLGNRY